MDVNLPRLGWPPRWQVEFETYGPPLTSTAVGGEFITLRPRSLVLLRSIDRGQ